jgi:hypothetical protein
MKKSKSTETEAVLDRPMTEETQTIVDEQTGDQHESQSSQELSEIDRLTNKRTGLWELALDEADIKWIRNHCNSKFSFTGPNEAFMLMNCYLGFASALARHEQAVKASVQPGPFMIQAIAIEACALMVNRFDGSGLESAQRVFRIAVALNGPISEMKQLDEKISMLKEQANSND